MKDLWTIASYPTAAVAGYFIALSTAESIAPVLNLKPWAATVAILTVTGLVVGFLIDEVIPTYIHEKRGGGSDSVGDNDFGGGGDLDGGDFNFD